MDLNFSPQSFSLFLLLINGSHLVKILHVCEIAKNEWMALVWDGTDSPPISINTK